jgi:ABC-type branched-subunit amino acid transport system substrate-binding protein
MHVPETGAAPLPQDWQDVLAVVQDQLNKQPVNGRKVQFVIEDDGYDPARGLAACRKLAGEDVFFVIGHTDPAVQDACAGFFQGQGIPYLMRGTYPEILSGRPLAWFGTIPDDVQGGLLGDYAVHQLGAATKKSAVIYKTDQSAAKDSFVSHVKAGGGSVVVTEQGQPRQPDYAATIQKLQSAGAQLVFLSMPPVDAIKIAVQAQGQGFRPTWLGGGTYWNYNMVLQSAGMAMDGAISLSPWPAVDSAAAGEYRSAYAQARGGKEAPDIGLIVWGWGMLARHAIEQAGPSLSRASLVAALNSMQFSPPYWNPINYTTSDHRGSQAASVFRADGQAKRWRQVAGFSSAF